MAVLIPTRRVTHAELAAGDVVVAMVLDGSPKVLPARRIVEGTRREDGALRMVRPGDNPHDVEWWLYPDQADAWIVERPLGQSARVEGEPTDRQLAQLATKVPRWRTTRPNGRGSWEPVELHGPKVEDPQVGDVVLVPAGDYYRAAVVTGVGPKRLRVTYTTPHGVKDAQRRGVGIGTTNPYVSRGAAYFVPATASWLPKL